MKKFVLGASLFLTTVSCFGSGYQINLEGLRQIAMGGTGAAIPWDASTIFYNPGGLSRLNSIEVYASGQFIMPSTAYGNQLGSYTTQSQTFTTFNVYVGGPLQKGSKFALGLGIYTPFGNGLNWGNNWLGKYMVQSVSLTTVFFQPTISYRINDLIAVGAGFIYAAGTFNYSNALPVHSTGGPGVDDGESQLTSGGNGVGFNVGVQIKASERLQIGLTYRSQVNMNVGGGTATFTVPESLASQFPDTHFDTQLPLPQVATVGVAYRAADRLTIEFDLNYTGWNSFDSLRINFSEHTSSLQDIHEPREYKNTWTPRIGANYKISKVVSVMVGGAYDPTPVTANFVSPDLPDGNRAVITGGLAVRPIPRLTLMAAFESTSTGNHNGTYTYGNFNGSYKTEAFTPGIGLYYKL